MKIRRGDIVLAVAPGAYGKTRPAVVVQSDLFNVNPPSVSVCLVTTHLLADNPFRIELLPDKVNGLELPSQVQVDKIMTLPVAAIRSRIGAVPAKIFDKVDAALRLWLDL